MFLPSPAAAQDAKINCQASSSTVTYRTASKTERLADVVVYCTGGLPVLPNQPLPQMKWTLTFEADLTSRALAPGWSEALLLADEPQPAKQLACTTADGTCQVLSTGSGLGTFDGTPGRTNVYQGAFGATKNTLTWTAPFEPAGAALTRTFRFTNLRVNTSTVPLLGIGIGDLFATGPMPAYGTLTVTGPVPINIVNPKQVLGMVGQPLTGNSASTEESGGRLSKFLVSLREGAADSFRTYSSSGPLPGPAQATPGGAGFNYETAFYNPSLPKTARGDLALAGLPDSGTRVKLVVNDLPGGTVVSVPLSLSFGSSGEARLIVADADGAGPYTPAQSSTLNVVSGSASATYEVTKTSAAVETITIPVSLTNATNAPYFERVRGSIGLGPTTSSQPFAVPSFSGAFSFTALAPNNDPAFVTQSLANGAAGVLYTQALSATGGRAPYVMFSIDPPPLASPLSNIGVPGLFLSSTTGVITGVPTQAGTYRFTMGLRVTMPNGILSQDVVATREFTLTILPSAPALQTSQTQLDFTASVGGGAPPQQSFRVKGSSQTFTAIPDSGSPFPVWLRVSPLSGRVPGLISVGVDPSGLAQGTYTTRIKILQEGNSNLPAAVVPVTFVVRSASARLESSTPSLQFQTWAAAPETRRGSLVLRNAASGDPIAVNATVLQSSSWINSVSPSSGSATASGLSVAVNIDTAGLSEGIYRDVVRFTSATGNIEVPVILRVGASGSGLDVNVTGVRFHSTAGAATAAVREIKILNREPGSSLLWSAELIRGSEYFSLSAVNGLSIQATPGTINLSAKPGTASLATGTYYGLVRLTAAGSSPRYVVAVLQVKSPAVTSLDPDPGGLMFTGTAGAQQTSSRTVALTASSSAALPYQTAVSMIEGEGWLTVTPATGTDGRKDTLTVTVDPRSLISGIYRGQITVAGADASQTISVNYVVRAATCTVDRLAIVSTSLANDFNVPAGLPAPLTVEVRDNCGGAVSNATVTARFSNGDSPLLLVSDGATGAYSATWQPAARLDQTDITFLALRSGALEARATLVGNVTENRVPTLSRGGTIHNLDPKISGLLSPGVVVQVYGSDLAAAAESTSAIPLATSFKGTSVLVGASEAPLYFVSPGQLVLQLPNELLPNRSYPIVVSVNGAITLPDQIDVVSAQPGVAAFADGKIIAQHADFKLVDAANPAKRGEYLVMYLVGMGASDQAVASGVPSPSVAPLPVLKIQPTVSVDGSPAQVVFSGLTPGGIGLYQINFKVPDNARLNAPLDVVVKQGPYTANLTTLTVAP